MAGIVLAFGSKDNLVEDVHLLSKKWSENARIVFVSGSSVREAILEKASALFVEENLVLVLADPSPDVVNELVTTLSLLAERTGIIIYSTVSNFALPSSLDAERVNMETEKQQRIKGKVLAAVRADGKKMTDKAYGLLKERVKDEALLDQELAKLISYVGDKKVIEAKDVVAVVTELDEEDFINLSEAIARKDRKRIITILDILLAQGTNLLAIHSFMARQIGLLLQARDAGDLLAAAPEFRGFSKGFGKLKEALDATPSERRNFLAYQKPYYAYNLSKTSQKFTDVTLLSLLTMLSRFDRMVKKGTRYDRVNFELGLLGI
jgi:DNA polymerase III delta subunit